jgi:LysM repeat protein
VQAPPIGSHRVGGRKIDHGESMTAGSSKRRSTLKIRRRGRHATPSQIEKVAAQAGKAAPAIAIAGALVAVPTARQASAATVNTYTVRSGDTLSLIAERFYHKAADWQWLYHENASTISDPDVLYVGQRISVPADPPASYILPGYQPKPATGSASGTSTASNGGSSSTGSDGSSSTGTTTDNSGSHRADSHSGGSYSTSGTYSCSALETLWESAGGSSSAAFTAAEIAMAESGGNPNALSPTNDYGLWQINGSNGSLATLDPYQNAKSAIALSGNGTNWDAWTTYTSGAYQGRC